MTVTQRNLDDPTTTTLLVADALGAAGIDAVVYGGLALAVWGDPRETKDADFAVAAASLKDVLAALRHFGLEAETSFDSVRFGGNDLTRVALLGGLDTTGLNVLDLVRPRSERFALGVLRRALAAPMRGREVRVVSPEDFVLLKTLSTRERDVEDAASVLRSLRGSLDDALIDREAQLLAAEITDHPILDRLSRART